MEKKDNKIPSLVVIVFLTVITAVIWVGMEVYRTLTTKPAPAVEEKISQPLDPNLDQITLDALGQRLYLDNLTQTTTLVAPESSPTPAPTVTPLPSVSPEGSPTASPEST